MCDAWCASNFSTCAIFTSAAKHKKMTYDELIQRKLRRPRQHGFEPADLNPALFDWQKLIVAWAVRQGRCALFEECGLGKTFQQLEWARQASEHGAAHLGNGKIIILCPLAVARQTIAEGARFGYQVSLVREPEDVREGINITNYERADRLDLAQFVGVVLDESSILKAFMGKTRQFLTSSFAETPYRLCCTATPAPNDYMEFGQHAEFLGVMPSNEMLSRFFINDTMNFGTYRLKGHAKHDFWRWVGTWAACVSKPSDIGFPDDGFNLPPLNMQILSVAVDQVSGRMDGDLFRMPQLSATNMHRELRATCAERVKAVADRVNATSEFCVVWCNTNQEADELILAIPDAIEVRGNDRPEHKEAKLNKFSSGQVRVIVTKPSIAGYGLNWQHCRNHFFVGLSYSFEDFYQAMRRGYRFGQKDPFNCIIAVADTQGDTLQTIQRKMEQHEEMRREMQFAAASLRNQTDAQLTMSTKTTRATGTGWQLYCGDACRVAEKLDTESVDFSIYSPPFANLYIYSSDAQDMGNCMDDDEFIEQYGFLIREKLRATKTGRLSAVHCKNIVSYANRDGAAGWRDFRGAIIRAHETAGWVYHCEFVIWKDPVIEMQRTKCQRLLFKQLCDNSLYSGAGMPEYLVVFRKWGAGMSQTSVSRDDKEIWPWIGYEHLEPGVFGGDVRKRNIELWQKYASPVWSDIRQTRVLNGSLARESSDEKHICPLQLDVIERALWLFSNECDLIYSPFAGIGSEGVCAIKMRRRFVGSELKESYWKHACEYLQSAERESLDLFFDLPTTQATPASGGAVAESTHEKSALNSA